MGWLEASEVRFDLGPSLLSLPRILDCGQAFRWRPRPGGWWVGVVRNHAVRLRRDGGTVVGQVFPPREDAAPFLASYLRLEVDLAALYMRFASTDRWMASAVSAYSGLRVLGQEPQETLLSYVCSTANSVPRIARSLEEISRRYGRSLGPLDGEELHTFPTAEALAEAPERELAADCGLGWRGANLRRVARELLGRGEGWPEQLRALPYGGAKARLMELVGIGPKIADCVCLFALGKDEAVPVDTHIWAVAQEIFGVQITTRTLTPATYATVAGLFVERYGPYAGWAQEYLYLQRRASQDRVRGIG